LPLLGSVFDRGRGVPPALRLNRALGGAALSVVLAAQMEASHARIAAAVVLAATLNWVWTRTNAK
jgi:hypothetical protein